MKLLRSADFRADGRHRSRRWLVRALAAGSLMATAALPFGPLATPAHATAGGTTVQGPEIWIPDPGTGGPGPAYVSGTYGDPGTVTVDKTQNVTNEVLHVSWTGFTPSTFPSGEVPVTIVPGDINVLYPVRIYECRGTNPKITDCYGSTQYNNDPAKGFEQPSPGTTDPDFAPGNERVALTRADGTGDAYIEAFTAEESQSLGCDDKHPCSIVVEPNYGGNSLGEPTAESPDGGIVNCDDHSLDFTWSDADGIPQGGALATDSTLVSQGQNGNSDGETCAWRNHAVVPLTFAPTPGDCKARNADFGAEGLPMFARAGHQWITGLCLGKNPLTMQYSVNLTEPQARSDFLQGINSDVAFTARPADPSAAHAHPFTYAPLANSSFAVVFNIDDPNTGSQILNMKLNARLLAKMLTQSYDSYGYDGGPVTKSVEGNPTCLFNDPEFKQLNPTDPNNPPIFNCPGGATLLPIVTGGRTDLVYQLTSWIAGDPDARAFLQGAPDPWGMHVDSYYLPSIFSGYPVESLVPQDSSGFLPVGADPNDPAVQADLRSKQFEWNPVQAGLTQVARNVLAGQPTCVQLVLGQDGQFDKCDPGFPGNLGVIGIVDSGQATAYRMPTAALLNPAGAFVQPTLGTMASAVNDMVTDKATGTQSLPYGVTNSAFAKDAGAYPLTTVQYAMVPTGGVSASKAAKIAQFLTTTTSSRGGQVYGPAPGQLAPGFLTLTPAQQAQAAAAAQHVAAQDGTPPTGTVAPIGRGGKAPTGRTGNTNVGAHTTSVGAKPPATQAPAVGAAAAAAARARNQSLGPLSVTGVAHPDQSDPSRLVLPLALIAGLVFLLGGPLGAVLLGTGVGSGLVRRIRNAAGGR